jgi:lipid II:glycine glycyltransferase (peptidoglycan interpeptide bridge formation enzyme)
MLTRAPMKINLAPKKVRALLPTDILFQTPYWGQVKSRLGVKPLAFDIKSPKPLGDVLVLLQPHGPDDMAAYVPQGPEFTPDQESYGPFLEELTRAMLEHLDPKVFFIRYDLPWQSRYALEIKEQKRQSFPKARFREMRMNMGTRSWNLRKASMDMTVASSVVVDIGRPEKIILTDMKPKTRYNIGLAGRRGVRVFQAEPDRLPAFYELYRQTAVRNGFAICDYKHFLALFNTHLNNPGNSELLFLMATHNRELLAGAIVAVSGKSALYLYGASSNNKKNFMAPYALHWEAMRRARSLGCVSYEMGAVSPSPDPEHPFYGLYRFKTGFGGKIEIRSGSWDYPLDEQKYNAFINSDNLSRAWGV